MKTWILAAAVLLFATVGTTAQTQLPWSVVGSGGSLGAQGNQRVLSATIGQTVIGLGSVTDGSGISQGFWLPIDTMTVGVDEFDPNLMTADIGNYPNPFSTSTTIRFNLPVDGPVTVRVFDLVGNLVRTIYAEVSMAGEQEVLFDGLTDTGAPLATGTYLYDVSATTASGDRIHRVRRMTIVR